MFKKIAIGFGVLIVLIAVGAYFFLSNLDGIIKTAMEKYGSEATQAEVKVGGVSLSATNGSGSITNLSIGNPKGFSSPQAFGLGEVKIVVDTSTIAKDVIVIKEVLIDKPQVTYEPNLSGGGNLETIQRNVGAYAAKMGGRGSTTSQPGTASTPSSEPEKKFIIESVVMRNGEVSVKHEALQAANANTSAALPTITLRDIGKAKGGATPAEISNEIIGAISQQAARVAASNLGGVLNGLRGGNLGGAGTADQLRGLLGR